MTWKQHPTVPGSSVFRVIDTQETGTEMLTRVGGFQKGAKRDL